MWESQEKGGENTQMRETAEDANKDISFLPLSLFQEVSQFY